jgi:hypothetical protein
MCLFDVHALTLMSGLELEEVLQFLRNVGKQGAYTIAIETGRDYCLDREKTLQAVGAINPPLLVKKQKVSSPSAKSTFIKMEAEPKKDADVDGWGGEKALLSLEFLQLKLAAGRMAAKREREFAGPSANGPAAHARKQAAKRGLPPGAISPSDRFSASCCDSIYYTGKFNREGRPALWLETSVTPPPRKVKELSKNSDMLQKRLDEMYRRDRTKTHTTLCIDLAKQLNDERGQTEKQATAETIRRITNIPGIRGPGGSKPRQLRST